MDPAAIRQKFGDCFHADERAFIMGIDKRFTAHFADRCSGLTVLETCTGGGFTTISLARTAKHVFSVDIDQDMQGMAVHNVARAGLQDCVTFINGDAMSRPLLDGLPDIEAAFLDPDWAISGPDHVHRFIDSTTRPPADSLLSTIFNKTENIILVLPPQIEETELQHLPPHELQKLYLQGSHELTCLYFGKLAQSSFTSELRID